MSDETVTHKTVDTGGNAFPVHIPDDGQSTTHLGMTLRDYFAGQALAGLLAYEGGSLQQDPVFSYKMADAMLAARGEAGYVLAEPVGELVAAVEAIENSYSAIYNPVQAALADYRDAAQVDYDTVPTTQPAPQIEVELSTMRLSGGREEYYVQIKFDGKTYDVRNYKQMHRNRAEYEVSELRYVLLGEDKPDLLDQKYEDTQPTPETITMAEHVAAVEAARNEALQEAVKLLVNLIATEKAESANHGVYPQLNERVVNKVIALITKETDE